jgi:CheY-like chemotaxis protein
MSSQSILVAEDNAIQREGTALVLRQEGYQVTLASTGQEVLKCLRSGEKFDLVLLDMMLPNRDGWSVLEEKNNDPALAHIPVVVMTALSVASREWAQSLGAAGFLRKPVDTEPLLKETRRLI